jgi:predicted molibdopterin-dependent oxidoreductase YjgC
MNTRSAASLRTNTRATRAAMAGSYQITESTCASCGNDCRTVLANALLSAAN